MAHRVLILSDQDWQDLTEILDRTLDYEGEYFHEYAHELTKLDGVTQEEYDQALETYNNEEGNDAMDNLAALSKNCTFASAVRLWRKIS